MAVPTLHFDGSCRPNPGMSSCGFVIKFPDGRVIEKSLNLGLGTNNTAEWMGLIHGLRAALDAGVKRLEVYGDSRVVIHGMNRRFRSMPHIERLKREARQLSAQFDKIMYFWVRRDKNAHADRLSTAKPSSFSCNHANEVPHTCPCPPDCYCRTQGSCTSV